MNFLQFFIALLFLSNVIFFSLYQHYIQTIIESKPIQNKKVTFYEHFTAVTKKRISRINSSEKLKKVKVFYDDLKSSENRVFSQNKEDGVIKKLNILLNKTHNGFYVEFGTEDAQECNTRYLRENFDWHGLLMDGSHENLAINLHKEDITHSNILGLFEKYNVAENFDLLSEDTDYAGK